jgi:hypothetical protein
MSTGTIAAIVVCGILLLVVIAITSKRVPRKLNQDYFQKRWLTLLDKVKTPEGMVLAVIDADKLLDEALKRRHFTGKTMGERMVKAQRAISDNDAAWYAHKLRNRLVHESDIRLKENEAKQALSGFRQALKDLGAL